MKKFYIYPPILVAINFVVLLPIGIIFVKKNLGILDYISIGIGAILTILFILSFILTHRVEQVHRKPDKVEVLVTDGIYSRIRHPSYAGIVLLNLAYLLFFRTYFLIPPVILFIMLWYLEAKYEESILLNKFGNEYRKYMKRAWMFFPKF